MTRYVFSFKRGPKQWGLFRVFGAAKLCETTGHITITLYCKNIDSIKELISTIVHEELHSAIWRHRELPVFSESIIGLLEDFNRPSRWVVEVNRCRRVSWV